MPFPKPGEPPKPMEPKFVPIFFVIWLLMMFGTLSIYVFALKWALKTKWSDFQVQLVRR
jgi:hypothetical protein